MSAWPHDGPFSTKFLLKFDSLSLDYWEFFFFFKKKKIRLVLPESNQVKYTVFYFPKKQILCSIISDKQQNTIILILVSTQRRISLLVQKAKHTREKRLLFICTKSFPSMQAFQLSFPITKNEMSALSTHQCICSSNS